jgi:hypothetical protein
MTLRVAPQFNWPLWRMVLTGKVGDVRVRVHALDRDRLHGVRPQVGTPRAQ